MVLDLGNTGGKASGRCKEIVQGATGNIWVTTLTPTIVQVTADIAAYDLAAVVAKNKAPGAVPARRLKERAMRADMEGWGHIVQAIADANPAEARAIIESMAMNVKLVTIPTKLPLTIELGVPAGTVYAHCKAGPKGQRLFYEVQYSLDGAKSWLPGGISTDTIIEIAGLPLLTLVTFRYRITHKNVPGDWSQYVTVLVH